MTQPPSHPTPVPKRLIVAITGASGAAYARRLLQLVVEQGYETHLVVSPLGQRLLHDELAMEGVDVPALLGPTLHDRCVAGELPPVRLHNYRDVGAVIASGSFITQGMVIIPCSSNSLSAVAQGRADNLLHRAAAVTLKERRPLLLVHREMPLSPVDIRNMQLATEAGAILCPASPGFYMLPKSIDDLVDFVVGRVLDLLRIPHNLNIRWGQSHDSKSENGPENDLPNAIGNPGSNPQKQLRQSTP